MEIAALMETEETIPLSMFGHNCLVTYRPMVEVDPTFPDAGDTVESKHAAIARAFCAVVKEWDATYNGEPLPINEETTALGGPISPLVMGLVISAVLEDRGVLINKVRQGVYNNRLAELNAVNHAVDMGASPEEAEKQV